MEGLQIEQPKGMRKGKRDLFIRSEKIYCTFRSFYGIIIIVKTVNCFTSEEREKTEKKEFKPLLKQNEEHMRTIVQEIMPNEVENCAHFFLDKIVHFW